MPLAAFCSDFCAASSARRATSIWVREARALASRAAARSTCARGRVAGLRHLLLLPQRAGPLLLEPGEACVLQLGQRQRGLRRLDAGAGLVDPLLDFVLVSFSDSSALARSAAAAANVRRAISIWIGTSLRTRSRSARWRASSAWARIELSPRDVDLVAVRNRVDLRHDLPLDDAVVLIGQEPDDPAGDQLRGDVDDVGLDEGVVGDRVGAPVLDPAHDAPAPRRRPARRPRPARGGGRAQPAPRDWRTEPERSAARHSLRGSAEPGQIGWCSLCRSSCIGIRLV